MKKFLSCFLILILALFSFSSCLDQQEKTEKPIIVTTVFAEYDWVRQILGGTVEEVELVLLTENGADLHSYQPTVNDIATIIRCDLLIHTGGVSDAWLNDAIDLPTNENRSVLRLMDLLSHEEKLTEQDHLHHDHDEDCDHDHRHEYDEHVWLSLKLAPRFCDAIADALCQKFPQHKDLYRDNCEKYITEIAKLDRKYEETVANTQNATLLFADRFPFSYLMNDYGITCFAAFPGCSSETETSFKTVSSLAHQVDQFKLPFVVILEKSDRRLAETVIATSNQPQTQIISLNSLQSIDKKEMEKGITYIGVMQNNLNQIAIALSVKN